MLAADSSARARWTRTMGITDRGRCEAVNDSSEAGREESTKETISIQNGAQPVGLCHRCTRRRCCGSARSLFVVDQRVARARPVVQAPARPYSIPYARCYRVAVMATLDLRLREGVAEPDQVRLSWPHDGMGFIHSSAGGRTWDDPPLGSVWTAQVRAPHISCRATS